MGSWMTYSTYCKQTVGEEGRQTGRVKAIIESVIQMGGDKNPTSERHTVQTDRQKLSHPIQRNYLRLTFVMEPAHGGRP